MSAKNVELMTFIIVSILFCFNSCSDDDAYNSGNYVVSLATVYPIDEQNDTYYLVMDDGISLYPTASSQVYKPRSNQRVLVNFTVLSDSIANYDRSVKVNYLQEILTKRIVNLTSENEKEIGNDPAKIYQCWVGDNYLNIHFGYNVSGQVAHSVNLACSNLDEIAEDDVIVLELRHNKNGDSEHYLAKSYVAFNLEPFQSDNNEFVNLLIKSKDLDGSIKEYRVKYKYNLVEKI